MVWSFVYSVGKRGINFKQHLNSFVGRIIQFGFKEYSVFSLKK